VNSVNPAQKLSSSPPLSKNVEDKIYTTLILPVVLYGSETWDLKITNEHRLRAFEDRMLRRIFVPGRPRINGSWRKLHNEEFHNLYSSSVIRIRVVK
jgi:hypothetical protein